MTDPLSTALAEVDALAKMLANLGSELRYALTRVGEAQIECARIRRQLREAAADVTPVVDTLARNT